MKSLEKWNGMQNLLGTVMLKHALFGETVYECDALQVINDGERLGVVVKGRELFVYIDKLKGLSIDGDAYFAEDDMLKIMVIVNKV